MSSNTLPSTGKPVKTTGLHTGDIVPGVSKVDPIIIANNITRTFGGLKAVDVEHLEIPRNAITALIGPNGAGKTTLFNLLTGFDKPNTGEWNLYTVPKSLSVTAAPPAELGRRFLAKLVDVVLGGIVTGLVAAIIAGSFAANTIGVAIFFTVLGVAAVLAFAAYQVSLTATQGQTIGKRALGLRVLSVTTTPGSVIGWPRAILRYLVFEVLGFTGITFVILSLSALWDKSGKRRGWQDLIAGSQVFALSDLELVEVADEREATSISGVPAFKVSRKGMVRTFQLTKALGLLTVTENMKLGATAQLGENLFESLFPFLWDSQDRAIEARAHELLKKFKLDAKADDYAASLSGGQRKLLEMARALMSEPALVMLDEPMAGVNPALTQSLLDHILDLKTQGMTVLFVEHDMAMVSHIADWVVVMAEGRVVAEGPPDIVMKDPAVIDAYLGAHIDTDLGVVTGRYVDPNAEAPTITADEIISAGEAEADAVEPAPKKPVKRVAKKEADK